MAWMVEPGVLRGSPISTIAVFSPGAPGRTWTFRTRAPGGKAVTAAFSSQPLGLVQQVVHQGR